jgi:hypothetical protein
MIVSGTQERGSDLGIRRKALVVSANDATPRGNAEDLHGPPDGTGLCGVPVKLEVQGVSGPAAERKWECRSPGACVQEHGARQRSRAVAPESLRGTSEALAHACNRASLASVHTTKPMGTAMAQISGVFVELERKLIGNGRRRRDSGPLDEALNAEGLFRSSGKDWIRKTALGMVDSLRVDDPMPAIRRGCKGSLLRLIDYRGRQMRSRAHPRPVWGRLPTCRLIMCQYKRDSMNVGSF